MANKKVNCSVFQPAFGFCAHAKAGQTTFFIRFQPFCSFQTFFSDVTPEINKKRLKKKKKISFVFPSRLMEENKVWILDVLFPGLQIIYFCINMNIKEEINFTNFTPKFYCMLGVV